MTMPRVCLLLLLVSMIAAGAAPLQAQPAADEDAIRHRIEDYVESWRQADVERLAQLLALDEGRVMWVGEHAGEQALRSMTFGEVLERRRPQPTYGLRWEVLTLDVIEGELAVSKVWISRSGGSYTDVLVWQKIGGAWQIVNKTFVVRAEE